MIHLYDDVSLSNHVSVPKIISGLAESIIWLRSSFLFFIDRPPSDKGTSLQQLELSLSRINHASNTNIILGGDFNLGHIDWSIPQVIPGKPETELNIKQFALSYLRIFLGC
jgi:hypothetical protein